MKILAKRVNVSFGDRKVIFDFSYLFDKREIYCIMGASGCGKTTLLRALSGLQGYQGSILIDKHKDGIFDFKVTKPVRELGFMHQSHKNFPYLTALQNVMLPAQFKHKFSSFIRDKIYWECEQKALTILNDFGLIDSKDKFPSEMSGGMNQRLSMARAVMQDSEILLMDEPLSALDPENRKRMQKFLIDYSKRGRMIIIVTHDLEECKLLLGGSPDNLIKL